MSDILAEVDEVMRQERLAKFWKENGTLLVIFIVSTIILTGAFSAYRTWDNNVKTTQTTALIELTNAADYPQNILTADLDFRPNLRAIALMAAAGTALSQNNKGDAYTLYVRIADDTKINDTFRHLAILMQTRMDLNKEAADAAALLKTLQPVLNPKSPYNAHARIEAAIIEANLNTNYAAAQTHLNAVLDTQNLPPTLYARAENLHHVYTLKAKQKSSTSQ